MQKKDLLREGKGVASGSNVVNKQHGKDMDGKPYLTKRLLVSLAKKATEEAKIETENILGYSIILENQIIYKLFPSGDREILTQIG